MPGRMRSRNSTTIDLGAEAAPDGAELQPDHAGSHHHELLRNRLTGSARPSDDTTTVSSTSIPLAAAPPPIPVAMTIALVASVWLDPSSALTSTCPEARDAAGAAERVDLVLLEQEGDTLDVAVHAFVLEGHHLPQVELGRVRFRSRARQNGRAPPRTAPRHGASALDGMQPMFRQVPPNVARASR